MLLDIGVHPTLALARLELRLGRPEAAARTLYGAMTWDFRALFDELRAQSAEQQHDTTTAGRAYRDFITLWKDADPELQPRVTAARAALARLEPR
jgi:hypothetical protein